MPIIFQERKIISESKFRCLYIFIFICSDYLFKYTYLPYGYGQRKYFEFRSHQCLIHFLHFILTITLFLF